MEMLDFETQTRVTYAETDQMGVVYYGNYARYYEIGRVEALRNLGVTYKEIENSGVFMPVTHYSIKFIKPAKYDDLITIKVQYPTDPRARMFFKCSIFNEQNELLNIGEVILAFIEKDTLKPIRCPEILSKALKRKTLHE